MPSKQLCLFATRGDLLRLWEPIESSMALQYIRTGMFDTPEYVVRNALLEIPDLGSSPSETSVTSPFYLVFPRGTPINVETVPQRRGGVKYAIDGLRNPGTLLFWPGGIYKNTFLVAGGIAPSSNDSVSLELYKIFTKHVRKQFKVIQDSRVGKEAEELLDKGWRLTPDCRMPPSYDIHRN